MQKTTESETTDLKRKDEASALSEIQRIHAAGLHQSELETAHTLWECNRKNAGDLLKNDQTIKETAVEARRYAAETLASTQGNAAAMLEASQAKAAAALKDSQLEAALALKAALALRDK